MCGDASAPWHAPGRAHACGEARGAHIRDPQSLNQLNRGSHVITSVEEGQKVADLNLVAGRRAKISTAYVSALRYLRAGSVLLVEETGERNYTLLFSIQRLMAECEPLTGEMSKAEDRLSRLPERASRSP
jgi:predicted ATPase